IKEELPEEEIINNEEDLTDEDKAMYEGYLDKVDNHAEEDLSEEEKAMYHSYLNSEHQTTSDEEETSEKPTVDNDELQEEVKENDKKDDLKDDDILEEKEIYENNVDKTEDNTVDEDLQSILSTDDAKIDEIRDSDLNMLENIIKGNEEEDGEELIRIADNKNENNAQEETKVKSVENFDSMEELLNKETNMSEEKELQTIEKDNVDSSVAVEDEFKLGDDNGPILIEEEEHKPSNSSDDDDFDGEITQSDLDYAIKLFESEETSGSSNEYSSKQDILLSENEINKFKKLFGYFKNIVEKMSPEDLNDFSKTEFYDMYSSLFRKFSD
uniref:hypothetical protein n=1 Tax=Brachyspira innocens TaxID=13264 RepID=UPI000529BA5A